MKRAYLRKYKPRKELSLREVKRIVAENYLKSAEKNGWAKPKGKWKSGGFKFGYRVNLNDIDEFSEDP